MTGRLLMRGMLAGLLAGLLAFFFARFVGEPFVDKAIAFEEMMSQAAHEMPAVEEVSRATQAGSGLFTGIMIYAVAIGGLFALAFAFAYGRIGRMGPRGTSALLACGAFVAVVVVPWLKYPANPPGVGSHETIDVRTQMFFVMILASIAGMVLAVTLARNLIARLGTPGGSLAAVIAYAAFIFVVQALLPSINEVPENFSSELLWNFRAAALGTYAVIWIALALLFGWLAERTLIKQGNYRPAALRH